MNVTFYTIWKSLYANLCTLLVLKIQFSRTTFDGSESSGQVVVSIIISRRTLYTDVNVTISLSGVTATGQ